MSRVPFDYPLRPYTFQLVDYFTRGLEHSPHIEGVDCVPETVEIQGIQQALGQMCLSFETIKPPEAIIVASPSLDRASVFSICFPKEIPDYDLPMDLGYGSDGVILPDTYKDEMDMISTGRILDASPPRLRSAFDVFGVSMLEFDGDGLVATDITQDTVSIEGASDSVDPPLSFDTMSGFVTHFDDISNGNNDMSIFEYLPMSQHFPLIAPPAPITHVCDVDDVGDTNDPPSSQSECDSNSDTEDRKVTSISGSKH